MRSERANQRVERTGGSRLAHFQFERPRRLPPVAHAGRSAVLTCCIGHVLCVHED
jgi:hypothetical protein